MAAYVPKYSPGQRVPGMVRGQRVYFGREFGRTGTVGIDLKPVDPRTLVNLKLPVTNPGAWAYRERVLLETLMYSAGYEIKKVLEDVIEGRGESHGITLSPTSSATMVLRGSGGSKPLLDKGRLLRGLRVEIQKGKPMPQLKVHFEGMQPSGAAGYPARPLGMVVELLERGYMIRITGRMQNFFRTMANVLKGSPKAEVYRMLGNKPVNTIMAVPARPFVSESIKAGVKNFRSKYMHGPNKTELTKILMGTWVRGRMRLGGQGVVHRAELSGMSDYKG